MTWSGWDIGVTLAFAAQIAGTTFVVRAALKIMNGPVKRVQNRVPPLLEHGKALVSAGQDAWQNNREQVVLLVDDVKSVAHSVHQAVAPPAVTVDAPINYQKIGTAWASVKTAQQGFGFLRRVISRRKSPKTTVSFAERIGLVPPAGKPVGRVIGAARFLLRVRGILKNSGVV